MSSVRLGDAMAALTAAFQASAALAGVGIAQGNPPSATGDPDFIVVGHDGSLNSDGTLSDVTEAGSFDDAFLTMGGPPSQEETGAVNVVAGAQTGDSGDLPGRITEVQRLLTACNDAAADLRSGLIVFDTVGGGRLLTRQTTQGCTAMISFSVGYTAPW